MPQIKLSINNKEYTAELNETILDVALRENIFIAHLCKHPDLKIQGNCRLCLVEIDGLGLTTACSTLVKEGLKIKTESPKIERARKTNLELIFSEHIEKCSTCLYQDNCAILKYAKKFNLNIARFPDRKKNYPVWQFGDSIQFDSSKCIDCRNCVEVCQKQACNFYEISERGVETIVKPKGTALINCHPNSPEDEEGSCINNANDDNNIVDALKNNSDKFDCTYCGQCVVHCPVGAISGVPHLGSVEKLLQNKDDKILIAEIAPSIRVSIGEEFGVEPGKIMTGQLAASIKSMGFDWVFDVNLGADFTTYEEAKELVGWLNSGKKRPMFTSCCPAWVKFVEFYYPEFINHLTTANSPHMCSGPIIKTYFANYLKVDPRDIVVVSIMPCTSKKHEINLDTHTIDLGWCLERLNLPNLKTICPDRKNLQGIKIKAVDYVLTTREYAHLLHKHKIDLPNLKPQDLDLPLGVYSGAGAIYGASGGVMESALRSADYFFRVMDEVGSLDPVINGENYELKNKRFSKLERSRVEFKEVRGQAGIKSAEIKVGNRKLKIAVANGLGNAEKILKDLKNNKVNYDYVEVMACPGGCVGGGGQPIPTNAQIRAKRAAAVYEIDKNLPIRTAHENPSVLEVYQKYFKGDEDLIEKILHSKFKQQEREGFCVISNSIGNPEK
ncbi:MAG TPA: [Fe-Fe] hydrogenase large subunit C-terminal domain-containing protein [bacterium]|nr:[Fe-Fe] hydrogenase large subunit C-terminal domain-containing protein [bacterium]HPL95358.1 [Fe-Fe] hydrogenase large subunit C-terminal domain-containing protein [bacterium]